jgi:hypothetical protein
MGTQKTSAGPEAGRKLLPLQFVECLAGNTFLDVVLAVLGNELQSEAGAVLQWSITDMAVPRTVMPRHTHSQVTHQSHEQLPLSRFSVQIG